MSNNQRVVALFGRQGHGKTTLMNKLTGGRFDTSMSARSCTSSLQCMELQGRRGIWCVDTPGFHSSTDLAQHVAAQKLAMEGTPLSGVYVVVKHARADDIGQMLGDVMDFLGDDVRIIVTHEDVAQQGKGYDRDDLKQLLSQHLGVPTTHIATVGKATKARDIEAFIQSTLHEPRQYHVNEEQLGNLAALCIGPRKVEKRIQEIYAKIQAGSCACAQLVRNDKSYGTDYAISLIQHDTLEMVKEAKVALFRWASEDLTEEQQMVVYGKAGMKLSLRMKAFTETTNAFLSYDVTDPTSPNNMYRMCPHCHEIFIKTEGCDGETTCGYVPSVSDVRVSAPRALGTNFVPEGNGWALQFIVDGAQVPLDSIHCLLRQRFQGTKTTRSSSLQGRGCGRSITWSQMAPVWPEALTALGLCETLQGGIDEIASRARFEASVREHEHAQRLTLVNALNTGNQKSTWWGASG